MTFFRSTGVPPAHTCRHGSQDGCAPRTHSYENRDKRSRGGQGDTGEYQSYEVWFSAQKKKPQIAVRRDASSGRAVWHHGPLSLPFSFADISRHSTNSRSTLCSPLRTQSHLASKRQGTIVPSLSLTSPHVCVSFTCSPSLPVNNCSTICYAFLSRTRHRRKERRQNIRTTPEGITRTRNRPTSALASNYQQPTANTMKRRSKQ